MHPHLLLLMLEEGGGVADGVAVEVSVVAAAISAFLGYCLGRFCVELPDILDASIVASNDVGGGEITDGGAMKSGGLADSVAVEVITMPGGSFPMFAYNLP